MYKSEQEFLNDYNPKSFDNISFTSDILIFSVSDELEDNYRKLDKKYFSVLLVKRDDYPFKDKWCLPGGFININETSEQAAKRILAKETNLHDIYLEQLYTFDSIDRDPRMRIISTSYMSLIDKNKLKDELITNASWFNICFEENDNIMNINLNNGIEDINFTIEKQLIEITTDRYNYKVINNDKLAFDHPLVITTGISRLKSKIEYTDIVFNMMPEYFTLTELQKVYEIILDKKLIDPVFRRTISSKVEKTSKVQTGRGHRPSALFKYKRK